MLNGRICKLFEKYQISKRWAYSDHWFNTLNNNNNNVIIAWKWQHPCDVIMTPLRHVSSVITRFYDKTCYVILKQPAYTFSCSESVVGNRAVFGKYSTICNLQITFALYIQILNFDDTRPTLHRLASPYTKRWCHLKPKFSKICDVALWYSDRLSIKWKFGRGVAKKPVKFRSDWKPLNSINLEYPGIKDICTEKNICSSWPIHGKTILHNRCTSF